MAAAATGMLSLYGGSAAFADTHAGGTAQGSPGLLSGNSVQAPADVPVNVCGNSVDAVAVLNPVFGNSCGNDHGSHSRHGNSHRHAHGDSGARPGPGTASPPAYGEDETTPAPHGGGKATPPGGGRSAPPVGHRTTPRSGGETTVPSPRGGGHHPGQPPALAHTGGDARTMLGTSAASAALIAAGAVLYRRGRTAAHR